jgi:hypothetical protein
VLWRAAAGRASLVAVLCLAAGGAAGCTDPSLPDPPNPHVKPANISSPGWKVTRRYTAHHALVVEVECRNRDRAIEIARELVEPIKETYVEALIYVRPIGSTSTRRVQWTRRDGQYRILDF